LVDLFVGLGKGVGSDDGENEEDQDAKHQSPAGAGWNSVDHGSVVSLDRDILQILPFFFSVGVTVAVWVAGIAQSVTVSLSSVNNIAKIIIHFEWYEWVEAAFTSVQLGIIIIEGEWVIDSVVVGV
jgi:hypothetical protein